MINKPKIAGIILGGAIIVLALLFYFQSQGFIKIFPSAEDREIKRILEIDESKFAPANGLDPAVFQQRIDLLYQQREDVLADPENAQKWFLFGDTKEFLNDHEGAVAAWKKTIEYQPQNFIAATNIATNYQYFIKDFEQAEFYYYQALFGNNAYLSAYQGLMDLYRYNVPEKIELYEPLVLDAIENNPGNAVTYYVNLVEFFAEEGNDIEKARGYLAEVESRNQNSAAQLRESYPEL